MNTAQIIGYDLRLCMCCGGYQLIIDNVPNPSGSAFYLVVDFPPNFNIGNNPDYPIPVKINWEVNNRRCFGDYLNILKIEKR